MDSSAAAATAEEGGGLPFADVRGKVAVLTLGTEEYGGISLAVEFVKRGCRVVLVGCPLARVEQACTQVRKIAADAEPAVPGKGIHGAEIAKAVELDATRGEQAVDEAVEEAWSVFGGIDILLSCTSDLGTMKPVEETTESDFDKIMGANVKEIWLVSKSVARKMQQGGRGGSLVFVTSISGTERGLYPGVSIYGTSTAAINHLTKVMAMELGKYGIRVNAIACGLAENNTGLKSLDEKALQVLAKRVVPLQRWLQLPNDITGVVLWLASDSSTFVTGSITIVDGGLSIRRPRMGEYRSRL
ncbi:unnamed protein product [Calypogeia fissa]